MSKHGRRMDRVDSGFVDFQLSECERGSSAVHRSNTGPTRQRRHKRNPTTASLRSQTTDMTAFRLGSDKEKRSKPTRQRSIASSSENSNYRSRGNGSKPSSRRTSVTIVDPSRPTRHYRIKSSQTVPTTNQDIDDVLALHFRSCSLFQNPSYQSHSALPSPTNSGYEAADTESAWARTSDPATANTTPQAPATDGIAVAGGSLSTRHSDESLTVEKRDTTMDWMSPSTRRREYERIDKANSGFRGFIRKLIPRCVSGPPPPRFYEKDQSDVGSVRRYRMDDTSDHEHEPSEKDDILALSSRGRKLDRPTTSGTTKTKKWILCS